MTDAVEAAREAFNRIARDTLSGSRYWQQAHLLPSFLDDFEAAIRADERSKVQPESALRAAARAVVAGLRMPSQEGIDKIAALKAALDGAPYEPSDAEVEQAHDVFWRTLREHSRPHIGLREAMRAALKAALGEGDVDG